MQLRKITTFFANHPRKLFFVDAAGALLTAVLLMLLVSNMYNVLGVPPSVSKGLAIVAFFIFVYSISCYFLLQKAWSIFLTVLTCINLLYCVLTLVLICLHKDITPLGIAYFTIELLIIFLLVYIELRTVKLLAVCQRRN